MLADTNRARAFQPVVGGGINPAKAVTLAGLVKLEVAWGLLERLAGGGARGS